MKWNRSIRVVQSDPSLLVISKQHLDGSRIGREAGFEPGTSFPEGLKRTAAFYHYYFTQVAPEKPARSDVRHGDEPIESAHAGGEVPFMAVRPSEEQAGEERPTEAKTARPAARPKAKVVNLAETVSAALYEGEDKNGSSH